MFFIGTFGMILPVLLREQEVTVTILKMQKSLPIKFGKILKYLVKFKNKQLEPTNLLDSYLIRSISC